MIVVDDCSTDNTADVIKDLASRQYSCKVRFAKTPKNSGTAGARNYGISLSTGDFIGFLDADDEYYPSKVAASVAKIAQFPQIGVAYSDYDIEYCGTHAPRTVRAYKPSFDFNNLLSTCIVSTNSVVWRRVFDSIGLFNTDIRGMEDYEFWLRAATKFAFTHIPVSLFKYREHGNNKTSQISPEAWAAEERAMKTNFINRYLRNNG